MYNTPAQMSSIGYLQQFHQKQPDGLFKKLLIRALFPADMYDYVCSFIFFNEELAFREWSSRMRNVINTFSSMYYASYADTGYYEYYNGVYCYDSKYTRKLINIDTTILQFTCCRTCGNFVMTKSSSYNMCVCQA
jgi:hypothetical protein